jgi:hypothetical protein
VVVRLVLDHTYRWMHAFMICTWALLGFFLGVRYFMTGGILYGCLDAAFLVGLCSGGARLLLMRFGV